MKAIVLNHLIIGYEGKALHLLASYKDFITENELVSIPFCWKYKPGILERVYWDSWAEGRSEVYLN